MLISSLQNRRIKEVVSLNNRRQRDAYKHTLVEGIREVTLALEHGVIPIEAYVCPEHSTSEQARQIINKLSTLANQRKLQLYEVTPAVFTKIAYREDSGGILLRIPYAQKTLADIPLQNTPLIAIVEGVEKPGNLGAILRTADAAGVSGVIVCGGRTDSNNPNVIRASLGACFTVAVVEAATTETITWLRQHHIAIIAATPDSPTRYTDADLTQPVAIVTGSEAHGVTSTWLGAANPTVSIPMHGQIDSLNLATATALMLYEAVRQRQPKQ